MNRLTRALPLVLALLLALTSCGQQPKEEAGELPVPVEGLYTCYSLSLQGLELETQRRWLRLREGGEGTLYLSELQEFGRWTLEGDAFLWTPENEGPEAAGTWTEGVLTLTIGEMTGIFVREGVVYPPPAESPEPPGEDEADPQEAEDAEETGAETAEDGEPQEEATKPDPTGKGGRDPAPAVPESAITTLPCYDGLYYVDYDPRVFTPGSAGGPDLVKADGTQVWLARLASRDLMDAWLAGMEEKSQYPEYLSWETFQEEAADCPARSILYEDETGWHAETVVDLGTGRGTAQVPMYAVYITCQGPTRESVWTEGVQALLPTLRLAE